jgi:hypothetical protein
MEFNKNDPAWKLCEASQAALNGDLDAIDRAFNEIKPTTQIIARAYALCLIGTSPFQLSQANRLIINTLQYRVAEDAARRMDFMTRAIVGLTVVLALAAVADIVMRWHCG